jgi:hypothetical protein
MGDTCKVEKLDMAKQDIMDLKMQGNKSWNEGARNPTKLKTTLVTPKKSVDFQKTPPTGKQVHNLLFFKVIRK